MNPPDLRELKDNARSGQALRILNPLSFVATAALNALGGAGVLTGGRGVGDISDANPTAITPASLAFSIWGVIYFLLALFCVWSAVEPLRPGSLLFSARIGWIFVRPLYTCWRITLIHARMKSGWRADGNIAERLSVPWVHGVVGGIERVQCCVDCHLRECLRSPFSNAFIALIFKR
eukprot:SAG11_NODE_2230_length_3658_cov_2.411071_1_plen_177_part_00